MTQLDLVTNKIVSLDALLNVRQKLKAERKKVVFTNGCFDILHLGHVQYLAKARQLGDVLIVGLNTDESVSRIKGSERPIQKNETRSTILASLQFVDYVVFFNEETPLQLIEQLIPDVLTKGADYKIDDIVGAEFVVHNGGAVKTIELTDGHSTTKIIDKLLHN